jgi:hypothetical protein
MPLLVSRLYPTWIGDNFIQVSGASMGIPSSWDRLTLRLNFHALTRMSQNSRRFARNGKHVRRRKRTSERLRRNVLELLLPKPIPPMDLLAITLNLLLAISRAVASKSNFLLSATNLVLKFLVNTRLHLVVSNSCRSTVTTICTLAIRHPHTALQTRCTANVITPNCPNDRAMLTS